MIPIEINDKNIAFRNLHFNKIILELKRDLISKRDTYRNTTIEYTSLDWINKYLRDILQGEPKKIRVIIRAFNWFIKRKSHIVTLSITKNNTTNKQLKQICRENGIISFSTKNKDELIDLINSNSTVVGCMIDNLKFINQLSIINPILKDIFINFYEKKWDDIKTYDRYTFVTKHNLKTCPYCNMGYILISQRDKNKRNGLRPEIDHFFPKSVYPYLAMSFYNLIPCCMVCNHTKKTKDTFKDNLLSPYEIDDNAVKFTYRPSKVNFNQVQKRHFKFQTFSIKVITNDKNSNSYFKLDKLYAQHKDVVQELLIKRTIYTKSYIEELKKNFHFTDDEIYRFLLCNYKENNKLNKRPLSKLVRDISEELGLI